VNYERKRNKKTEEKKVFKMRRVLEKRHHSPIETEHVRGVKRVRRRKGSVE